jgi:hypothetical protein
LCHFHFNEELVRTKKKKRESIFFFVIDWKNACEGNAPVVLHLIGESRDRKSFTGARRGGAFKGEEFTGEWI